MNPESEYALDRLYSIAAELVELAPRLPTAALPSELTHVELAFIALAFAVMEGGKL